MSTSSEADKLKANGYALVEQGDRQAALAAFEAAAAAYKELGELAEWAEVLNNQGVLFRLVGEHDASRVAFDKAMAAFRGINDLAGQGQARANLADLEASTGRHEAAVEGYGQAAELLAKAGEREKQSDVLRALSLLNIRRGKFWQAIYWMNESLQARPRLSIGQRLFSWLLQFGLGLWGGG